MSNFIMRKHPNRKFLEWNINENNCFIVTSHFCSWSEDRNSYHYPAIRVFGGKSKQRLSRYIYEQCFGEVSPDLVIRHKCDDPRCINPEHLELGTQQDNVRDIFKRCRRTYWSGENSKLTESQVKEIIGSSKTQRVIANEYGISISHVSNIKRRKAWTHL